jgi:hypothetical protein
MYNDTLALPSEACGLCGRDCEVSLVPGSNSGTLIVQTLCPNYVKFSYKAATKATKAGPCTNVPVRCPVCNPVKFVWKYALAQKARNAPNASRGGRNYHTKSRGTKLDETEVVSAAFSDRNVLYGGWVGVNRRLI